MSDDHGTRRNQYFVPGEGIAREVITSDICKYLDNDATVRPYNYQGRDGYMIYAYRNLTTAMMDDLKRDTVQWQKEQTEKEKRRRQGGGAPSSAGGRRDREQRYDPYPSQGNGRGAPHRTHEVAMEDYRNSATHERRLQIQSEPNAMQMAPMPMDMTMPETSSPHGSSDGYSRPPYANHPPQQQPSPYGMNNPNQAYGPGMQNQQMHGSDDGMYPGQPMNGGYDQRGHPLPQQGYNDHMQMSGMSGPGAAVSSDRGYGPGPSSGPGPYQSGNRAGGGSNNDYYDNYSRNSTGGSRTNHGGGYTPDGRSQGGRPPQYSNYPDSRGGHPGGRRH